jgi:CRP-like cAMP-binding protein
VADDAADVVARELDLRAGVPFVQSEAQLRQMLALARRVDFHPGQRLFERGTAIAHLYILQHGDVELAADSGPSWTVSGPGAIGFVDFMLGHAHARTATARTDVRALELDAADYREYLQDNVDVAHAMLTMISDRQMADLVASRHAAALLARPADAIAVADDTDPPLVDRLLLLTRVPAFARATVQALANLAHSAQIVRFAAGDVIAAAGARESKLSILIRGQVELAQPGSPLVALRGPVDLVCYAAELSAAPRLLTARAVTASLVLQIEREELLDRLDEHFELGQSLLAYVAGQREALNNANFTDNDPAADAVRS